MSPGTPGLTREKIQKMRDAAAAANQGEWERGHNPGTVVSNAVEGASPVVYTNKHEAVGHKANTVMAAGASWRQEEFFVECSPRDVVVLCDTLLRMLDSGMSSETAGVI